MSWYYLEGGKILGPVDEATLSGLVAAGRVGFATLVWREGLADWMSLAASGFGSQAAPATATAEPAAQGTDATPLEFTGAAGEYFRIWIVNVALTILTLGIYAAWAKVRKRRYFYAGTRLGGRSFEYTGNPIAILKGNLIMGAAFIAYVACAAFYPTAALAFPFAFAVLFPWLIYKALRFNAHNTRYRNIRFRFHGTVGESYAVHLGWPMLTVVTLGLIVPYVWFRQKRYQLGRLSFGVRPFEFEGRPGPFYRYAFAAGGIGFLAGMVGVVTLSGFAAGGPGGAVNPINPVWVALFLYVPMFAVGICLRTWITRYALSVTSVDALARLRGTMTAPEVLWLELSNIVAIILSLGLAIPWAAVRRARYRASRVQVFLQDDVEKVVASAEAEQAAVGDAAADVFDFDIAF